jgi:hypothetical protein
LDLASELTHKISEPEIMKVTYFFVRELMKLDEAGAADREERKKEMERVKSARYTNNNY